MGTHSQYAACARSSVAACGHDVRRVAATRLARGARKRDEGRRFAHPPQKHVIRALGRRRVDGWEEGAADGGEEGAADGAGDGERNRCMGEEKQDVLKEGTSAGARGNRAH
eukprot:1890324-Pleurochrysis_carterae.AAC.1